MPELTPPELSALRSQSPHTAKVDWYLALAPYGDSVFTAQVNDAGIARGERDIVYYNDVGEADVEPDMTLWVGSDPGTRDIGTVRIRAINAGANTLTVAENDDIEWADDLHLTCPGEAGFFELWGVLPRITEAAGVVTFYEDYDQLFAANPDDTLPPKANAGPPACAIMDGGSAEIAFVGDRSFTPEVGAALVAYVWDFADGVVVSGAANQMGTCDDPNVVRFDSPGFRYVSLTVTDNTARARTEIVRVPVWVFDDDNPPLMVQSMVQEGNPSWRLNVTAFASNDASTEAFWNYPDGALVVLFCDIEYPDGSTDVGGFCYRSNIRFVGWLEEETLSFDFQGGTVSFSAIGHDLMMKKLPGYAYTLEDDDTPSDWYEVADLDIDRAAHCHLERRSTVNNVCHVERLGDGQTRTIDVQPFPDMSVYDQVQEHLYGDAMATLLADRQGTLYARRDPQMMDLADRGGVATTCTLVNTDLLNDIDEGHPHQPGVGLVRLGGFAYATPYLSQAPGDAPTRQDASTYREGFLVEDQTELNLWSGCLYQKQNNPFPDLTLELKGTWPVFDPAYQEFVNLTLSDPLRRNEWEDELFVIRDVAFRDDAREGTFITELGLEKQTPVYYGETQTIPAPPTPSPPNPPPGPSPPPNWCGALSRVILRTTKGIFITNNFDELDPNDVLWEASNNALDDPDHVENLVDMAFDFADGDRLFAIVDTYDDTVAAADKGLFRCSDIWNQAAWEQMADGDYPYWALCTGGCAIGCNPCGGSNMCRDDVCGGGAGNNDQRGVWRSIGCDPGSGHVCAIGGVYDISFPGVISCRQHAICFYSADALTTITCGDSFLHATPGHKAVVWGQDRSNGQITSSGDVFLFTYSCGWASGSDRHRALSWDGGATIVTSDNAGEIWGSHTHLWHTRAGQDVLFYTDQGGVGTELAISDDDGLNFDLYSGGDAPLPGTPIDSGQALGLHFMDTSNVMMVDDTNTLYYCTDGGFTWAACGDQSPDTPFVIVPCADTAWPIPDGWGYITGADKPTDDDDWVFLTRDMGTSWENRTGNLGDFLDHAADMIWQIIPVQEGC